MADKTLVIWWRFGKEHGKGDGFGVNPPTIIEQHLDAKAAHFRNTPDEQWRWFGRIRTEPRPEERAAWPATRAVSDQMRTPQAFD